MYGEFETPNNKLQFDEQGDDDGCAKLGQPMWNKLRAKNLAEQKWKKKQLFSGHVSL